MTQYKGKDFLLSIQDTVIPTQYNLIGGMQSNAFTRAVEAVDVTTKQSAPERSLLDCGIRTSEVSGSGVLDSDANLRRIIGMQFGSASAIAKFKIAFADGGIVIGDYLVSSFERTGEYNQAETFSLSMTSAGPQTYTPPV